MGESSQSHIQYKSSWLSLSPRKKARVNHFQNLAKTMEGTPSYSHKESRLAQRSTQFLVLLSPEPFSQPNPSSRQFSHVQRFHFWDWLVTFPQAYWCFIWFLSFSIALCCFPRWITVSRIVRGVGEGRDWEKKSNLTGHAQLKSRKDKIFNDSLVHSKTSNCVT